MTDSNSPISDRWLDYFLRHGIQHEKFWNEYLKEGKKDILMVLGIGFDPRMCMGVDSILKAGGEGKRDVIAIEFHRYPSDISHSEDLDNYTSQQNQKNENLKKIDKFIEARGKKIIKNVQLFTSDGRIIGSRKSAEIIGIDDIINYSDIIIDISALPRYIYFPLIGKLLYILDQNLLRGSIKYPNLFVIVAENADIDRGIKDEEIEETANYMYGFASDLESEATENIPKIWIPILGEFQIRQLEKIFNLVNPEEICPILPSPSVNPRRGDDLLIEYRDFLFDRLNVEPRNIIYAAEQNPFEVYKQIIRTFKHYNEVLLPLGGCKVAISAVSSKLMSIGALLAAYELKNCGASIGIANVETREYGFDSSLNSTNNSVLFTLWLKGECYE